MAKVFDLDEFVKSLEEEEDIRADFEARFIECPKCGSDTWDTLKTDKRGKAIGCNECKDSNEQ